MKMMNTRNQKREFANKMKNEKKEETNNASTKAKLILVREISLLECCKYFYSPHFRYLCLLPLETSRPTLGIVLTICMSLK